MLPVSIAIHLDEQKWITLLKTMLFFYCKVFCVFEELFCLAMFSFRTFTIFTLIIGSIVLITLNEWKKFELFCFNVWVFIAESLIFFSLVIWILLSKFSWPYVCKCTHDFYNVLNFVFFTVLVPCVTLWEKKKNMREQLFQLLSHFIWDHLHLNKVLPSSCQCLPSKYSDDIFLSSVY